MAHSISLQRLQEIKCDIWTSHGWNQGCTDEECKQIKAEWSRMPGSYSFFDAVTCLIREAEEGKQS